MTKNEIIELLKNSIEELENSIIDDSDYQLMDEIMTTLSPSDYRTFGEVDPDDITTLLLIIYEKPEIVEQKMKIYSEATVMGNELVGKLIEVVTGHSPKEIKKRMPKIINSNLENDINELFKDIYSKMNEIKKDIDNQRKYRYKLLHSYKKTINIIVNNEGIIDFDKINNLKMENSIKYKVLVYILKHNANINSDLIKKNNSLCNNDKLKIKTILSQYGYDDFSFDSIEKLLTIPPNLLEEKLNLLKEIKFNNEQLLQVLLYSKVECIDEIINVFSKNLLDLQNLMNNFNILFDEENLNIYPMYNNFMSNIKLLKTKEFNIHNLNNQFSILLMDYEILYNNIKLLEKYGFDLKILNNFNLLENIATLDIIDSFIEQDLYNYILDNQQIIKNDYNIVIRLIITKYLRLPIFNNNNRLLTSITSGKGFDFDVDYMKTIIKNDVEMYLHNKEILKNSRRDFIIDDIYNFEIIKKLEQFKIDDVTLKIEEQLVSYNKVLRNFSVLYLNNPNGDINEYLLDSLLYGSIIEKENIELIQNKIQKNKKYTK